MNLFLELTVPEDSVESNEDTDSIDGEDELDQNFIDLINGEDELDKELSGKMKIKVWVVPFYE